MGKQMSKPSVKISNHHEHRDRHHHNHRKLNCLKPKVYITHSSSFKTLVQELTGNSSEAEPSFVSAISPPPHEAETDGLQIKHEDRHARNKKDYNSQDNMVFLDDKLFTTSGYTPVLETDNHIDFKIDTFSSLFD
ncbi:hypothetical protein Hanom_Chr16g01504691 [Helianthus anomalus]